MIQGCCQLVKSGNNMCGGKHRRGCQSSYIGDLHLHKKTFEFKMSLEIILMYLLSANVQMSKILMFGNELKKKVLTDDNDQH